MIANLVKKDFLLVKKSIAAFLGISILVPLLVIILMRNTNASTRNRDVRFSLYGNPD